MLTLLLALSAPALAGSERLDAVLGWGDHVWGSAPTADLVAVGKDEELVYYGLPEGERSYDGLPVHEVVLGYSEDQLVAFRFSVEKKAVKEMKGRFGRPSRKSATEKFWIGDGVKLTVAKNTATFTSTQALGRGAAVSSKITRVAKDGATEKGTLEYLDTRPGWRDLAWGSVPANGMERVDGEDGGEAYYVRDTDKLFAGDFPLSSIGYGYYQNQLFSVMLILPDYASFRGIRNGLEEAYGAPSVDEGSQLAWQGERVDLTLTFDEQREQGAAIYFYVPVREALEKAEAEAAQRAADDL